MRGSMHWTHDRFSGMVLGKEDPIMKANDRRSTDAIRHGAYLCFSVPPESRRTVSAAPVPALAERLGFANEFETKGGHPKEAIAFLRRVSATPGDIADDALVASEAVV